MEPAQARARAGAAQTLLSSKPSSSYTGSSSSDAAGGDGSTVRPSGHGALGAQSSRPATKAASVASAAPAAGRSTNFPGARPHCPAMPLASSCAEAPPPNCTANSE